MGKFFALFCASCILSVFLFINFAKTQNTDLVVSEIGAYEASGHEWIEVFNKGTNPVDMAGWKFWENDQNHGLALIQGEDTIIEPGEYMIIAQNDVNFINDYPSVSSTIFDSSWGSLNEGGEEIALKDADGNVIEQFTYVAAPNFSLERKDVEAQDYSLNNWVEHPESNSVGEQNYWHVEGAAPEPQNIPPSAAMNIPTSTQIHVPLFVDASGSSDKDGQIIAYLWNFGDGGEEAGVTTSHTYTATGTFQIMLTVTDEKQATGTEYADITVFDPPPDPPEEAPEVSASVMIINEFVSDPSAEEHEWIELFNTATSTADLDGLTIEDGAGLLAAPTSTVEANGFFVIELTASKLNNAGDAIILKYNGEVIDRVSFGDWDDGNVSDNAMPPEKGNALARAIDGKDTGDDAADFKETTTPTKGTTNLITTPDIPEPEPEQEPEGPGGETTPTYFTGDLVINELVSDPEGDEEEFIELYNTTNNTVPLDAWQIREGSGRKTTLNGTIPPKGFFVVNKPSGNLNNSGDIIFLYDPSETLIDRAAYGNWDDGNISDNAPAAEETLSLARTIDGKDTDNDANDFLLTSTITKGVANVISEVLPDEEIPDNIVYAKTIIVNEIFPNPPGSDNEAEFIEIKNIGNETIDLSGWRLGDGSTKRHAIDDESIAPGDLLVFKRSETGIALNNSGGDAIKIFAPDGMLVDEITYEESTKEGESYVRLDDNSWGWTIEPTPGEKNHIKRKTTPPEIVIDADTDAAVGEAILFDASDTTDPNGQAITFVWNFGDGKTAEGASVEHRFLNEGIFSVTLKATNTAGDSAESSVVVTARHSPAAFDEENIVDAALGVRISEFIPNPVGSDAIEFIELVNPTRKDIDISGLKLDDEEGGSRAYTIPSGSVIPAENYLVFWKEDTRLALNNTTDAVRLMYPDGTIIREVRYEDVPEGASYIQDEKDAWHWTGSPTPGELNVLTTLEAVAGTKITSNKRSPRVKPTTRTTIDRLPHEDLGDMVMVAGVVAVEPGVLGSQYFYIVDPTVSTTTLPGIQIYSYKKDFPKLQRGDRIEVVGELSEASGELRIKTAEAASMRVIGHVGDPTPLSVDIAAIGEPLEGSFVRVHGEVTEIKGSYMYLDDGTGEIKVYFKSATGINKKLVALGDLAEVRGLIHQTKTDYQLLPRSQKDIIKTGVTEEVVAFQQEQEKNEGKEVAEKYLTATAGGLTSILFGLFAKSKGGKIKTLLKKIWLIALLFFRRRKNK